MRKFKWEKTTDKLINPGNDSEKAECQLKFMFLKKPKSYQIESDIIKNCKRFAESCTAESWIYFKSNVKEKIVYKNSSTKELSQRCCKI